MKSIMAKLSLVIVAILFIFACALLAANTFFLDNYYVYKTKNSFVDTSEKIQQEFRNDKENILQVIRDMHTETGYKIQIVDEDYYIGYSSVPEFDENVSTMIGYDIEQIIESEITNDKDKFYYGVYQNANDSFVLMIDKLNQEDFIVITQPLEQITKNAEVANDFLLIIGIVMLIVASLISLIFANRLIKPILEIKDIADSIAKLDFSQKYNGQNKDEIGDLGSSINNISQRLNDAIDELKHDNEQLIIEMKLQKRFIASISHEFNTPVGLIRGYAEALEMGMYSDEQEKTDIINIIINEADRLNHLVNDIILIIKLDSKAFSLKRQSIDIIKLLHNSVGKIEIKAKDKNIKLTLDSNESIFVNADPIRITQVADNLLSNAIIHTPLNGEISVSHRLNKDSIKISVVNTGPIISEEDMEHLFDAFYRAQDARSREKGGSGLGLSIVAGIISAHKGRYGVDNTDDGVDFWFMLPKNK